MYPLILMLHVLGATVWTGGHLVLALTVLPRALRERSPAELLRFEAPYERIGMPALLLQVVTGVWLALHLMPDVRAWFDLSNPLARAILTKLGLLLTLALIAADARIRILPRLSDRNLVALAWHVVPVTILSVLFVLVGVMIRFGGLG
ncbi:MAG: CopD family protein [Candidatus Eisenbacteria bacterium]|nr:CopD family protein [Candidatus Eisenbacteria bacterium]